MAERKRSNFHNDRLAGEAGERRVAQTLKVTEQAVDVDHTQNGKEYDFSLIFKRKARQTYEVKSDFMAAKTGNIFFEYSCNKKESGLTATKAHKWAVLLTHLNEILVFSPILMWNHLQKSAFRQTNGGDGWRARGYLVSIEDVKKMSFVRVLQEIPLT